MPAHRIVLHQTLALLGLLISLCYRKRKEETMATNHKGWLHYDSNEGELFLGTSLHVYFTSDQFVNYCKL